MSVPFPFSTKVGGVVRNYRVFKHSEEHASVGREASEGVTRAKNIITIHKHAGEPWPDRELIKGFVRKLDKAGHVGTMRAVKDQPGVYDMEVYEHPPRRPQREPYFPAR